MPKINITHEELCPMGAELDANKGETVLDVVLKNGIKLEHVGKSCACTTCHVIIKKGFDSLEESSSLKMICLIKRGDLNQNRDLVVKLE